MNNKNDIDDFEERLLNHVEMVYAVAFELTRNPMDAEHITHSTVLRAWRHRDTWAGCTSLKPELLRTLRRTYMEQYLSTGLQRVLWTFNVPSQPQWSTRRNGIRPRTSHSREKEETQLIAVS